MTGTAALYMNEPNANFMANYDAYYTENKYQPQVLDNNILFGTLQSILNHPDTIRDSNVRFFIGIDIPTEQMAELYNSNVISNLYNSTDEIIMVNFDSRFIEDLNVTNLDTLNLQIQDDNSVKYLWNNSQLLKIMVTELSKNNDLSQILHRYLTIYKKCNTFIVDHIERFQTLNDLLTLFHMTNPQGKAFIFSNSISDENLITLLISTILKKDPLIKVQQAYQFITNLMDTVEEIKTEKIFLCSGLTNYIESVKKFNAIHGRRLNVTNNNNSSLMLASDAKRSMTFTNTSNCNININSNAPNDLLAQTAYASSGKRARCD